MSRAGALSPEGAARSHRNTGHCHFQTHVLQLEVFLVFVVFFVLFIFRSILKIGLRLGLGFELGLGLRLGLGPEIKGH